MVSAEVSRADRSEARTELYKGECNDPLWHGVFGGLYLPHLREASYEHLLKAEAQAAPEVLWTATDFDRDGRPEWVWRDRTFGLIAKPSAGGTTILAAGGTVSTLTVVGEEVTVLPALSWARKMIVCVPSPAVA